MITGAILGCEYALLAASWGVIFKVTKTFHFAHAVVYTLGAYFALIAFNSLGMALIQALTLGVLGASLAGCLIEVLLYKPLRRAGATHEGILIASLGLLLIIEMLIVLLIGDGPQSIDYHATLFTSGDIAFTNTQAYSAGIDVLLIAGLLCFMSFTRTGRTMEAVAINVELAALVGIGVQKIFNYAFLVGSALAGLAGALALVDRGIDPFAGTMPITMAFIAVIVGGVESILGGAMAGFILGMSINLCAAVIPSEFQHVAAFSLVILLLIVRPEGLLGIRSR